MPNQIAPTYARERAAFEAETDAYYRAMPNDVSRIERRIATVNDAHPDWSPFRRKTSVYEAIAEHCPVTIFRHFPFYLEVGVGKPRTNLGEGGIGQWMKLLPVGKRLAEEGAGWWSVCYETGLSLGWQVLDDNHHSLGLDNVFRYGLNGLLRRAMDRRDHISTEMEHEFLDAMATGLRAQMRLANRMASEAESMAAVETEPHIRVRLERIAETARRVPAEPPRTFYEGLCAIQFMRSTTQSLEGNGISILGHFDRMLGPLYEADLVAGRITRTEAEDLLAFALAMEDAWLGTREAGHGVGSNGTVMIGGCDRDGVPVFNDVTRMIVELYTAFRFVNPKLNIRVSREQSSEYTELLARFVESGVNVHSFFNDDVVIPANVKMGKALEDCRLYVGGGCQENVLENTEVNSRATIYMSLAAVLLMGFFPDRWETFTGREEILPRTYDDCDTFDEFLAAFLENLRACIKAHADFRNRAERLGTEYNPCPLHSATLDDCIERATDMMAGGARYNYGSVSLAGIGTLIDSLFAVREIVYEHGRMPLQRLRDILDSDFAGEEALRRELAHRMPKFGHDDDRMRTFSAHIFAEVARVARGHANGRGGLYEASLFSFRTFIHLGERNGATPDGRRAGEYLSPGMSPSPLALDGNTSVTQVLRALQPLDLTLYPVVGVLDVKLPLSRTGYDPGVIEALLDCFIEYGGSVLQVNIVDQAELLDAREHPERHPDLVVRVSGYSAYFTTLPEAIQREVVDRALLGAVGG